MAESETRTLTDKFMLRLPDGMRSRIKAAAESNNRSMNSEIVATLEEKYPPSVQSGLADRLKEMSDAMKRGDMASALEAVTKLEREGVLDELAEFDKIFSSSKKK